MDEASSPSGGHFPPVQAAAEARALLAELLASELVQDALVKIGPEPPADRAVRWRNGVHVTRTRRAQRIYLIELATRRVLTSPEIDHYASIICIRRQSGVWPPGAPPPVLFGGSVDRLATSAGQSRVRRPNISTVRFAAATLAECVHAVRIGSPEDLTKSDHRRLSQVLRHFGLEVRSLRPAFTVESAKKRRQRAQTNAAPVVAAERKALEGDVATGRSKRISDGSTRLSTYPTLDRL
jgi:hypothetical protein